jgi:pimeloyl-ACP methyl ester carboxylesterase
MKGQSRGLAGTKGELCRVLTRDRLELHGFLANGTGKPVAAVLHVHGWDGNFYENRFIYEAARVATWLGYDFLTANNRGHDYIADILRETRSQIPETRTQSAKRNKTGEFEYVQLGGIYEKLANSVADIAAWVDFLAARGCRSVILHGHSHGAIKVLHYLHKTRDKRVRGLVLLSPSDDLGWGRALMGRKFDKALRLAGSLTRQGNARQLLPEGTFQYPVSAGTFLDCFGPRSIAGAFNMSRTDRRRFPELASVAVPVLVAVGAVEEAFVGDPAAYVTAIDECMTGTRSFTGVVVDGAPHNYLGREEALGEVLGSWLAQMG